MDLYGIELNCSYKLIKISNMKFSNVSFILVHSFFSYLKEINELLRKRILTEEENY